MCALKVKSSNQACKSLYDRLRAKGKPVKLALIAVANKLLEPIYERMSSKQAFNIAKSGKAYSVPDLITAYFQTLFGRLLFFFLWFLFFNTVQPTWTIFPYRKQDIKFRLISKYSLSRTDTFIN
jgi:hypothetical protein